MYTLASTMTFYSFGISHTYTPLFSGHLDLDLDHHELAQSIKNLEKCKKRSILGHILTFYVHFLQEKQD